MQLPEIKFGLKKWYDLKITKYKVLFLYICSQVLKVPTFQLFPVMRRNTRKMERSKSLIILRLGELPKKIALTKFCGTAIYSWELTRSCQPGRAESFSCHLPWQILVLKVSWTFVRAQIHASWIIWAINRVATLKLSHHLLSWSHQRTGTLWRAQCDPWNPNPAQGAVWWFHSRGFKPFFKCQTL